MKKLAVHGGTPVRSSMLPYATQSIDDSDVAIVSQVMRSSYLTQGPWVEKFEQAICDRVGANYAVAFSSGTAALHGAYQVAGLGPGDKMITSPITFVATSNAAFYTGASPDFADIDPNTYLLDPTCVKSGMSDNVKLIAPVDFTGQPAPIDQFKSILGEERPVILQDAAHSLGAIDQGRPVGKIADMTMFSFHPVKQVTTGEGGMIVTDNADYAKALVDFRSHGITRDSKRLIENHGPWYYEMQSLGYHYRMTDLQAALGCNQLLRLDEFLFRRRMIASTYQQAFANLPGIQIPTIREGAESAWHLYVIQWRVGAFRVSRKELFEAMRAENIGVHVHYIPVHHQPYYQKNGFAGKTYERAESYYLQAMTLPLFPAMTDQDVTDVIDAIHKVYNMHVI